MIKDLFDDDPKGLNVDLNTFKFRYIPIQDMSAKIVIIQSKKKLGKNVVKGRKSWYYVVYVVAK